MIRALPLVFLVLWSLPSEAPPATRAVPSLFEKVRDGVYVVRDDMGHWTGEMSRDISHQNAAPYQARKTLDLSRVPADVWARTRSVRLSAFFVVRDYSWHDHSPANGLDEAYEIVVNGTVFPFPTGGGAPAYNKNGPPSLAWHDHLLPKDAFRLGPNEVILRKAPSPKNDDYLYLGIDLSARRGNSAVSFDGRTWRQDMLTVPGGNGEYMVRLYLITGDLGVRAVWRPEGRPALSDPARLVQYAGAAPDEVMPGRTVHVEWDPLSLDPQELVRVSVDAEGPVRLAWLDVQGKLRADPVPGPTLELPARRTAQPSGIAIYSPDGMGSVRSVTVEGAASLRLPPPRMEMCPPIARPAGRPVSRRPACRMERGTIRMENAGLRCRFSVGRVLRLESLYNEITASEMVRRPADVALFLVEVNGRRYAGSRDFRCLRVRPVPRGFEADLALSEPKVRATLIARMEEEGLRLGLSLANADTAALPFKLTFPHLAGLAVSPDPSGDRYFYPLGGGIFTDAPALIRATYGDHQALYQVMDLFSPRRGGGLYLRADDSEGWHKVLSLRKHVPGRDETTWERVSTQTATEYKGTNPLEAVQGTSLAIEYLRRTREPGKVFTPAPVVLAAHAGDWHAAMRAYSAWAHRVWRFRPYPSRLKDVHNMTARGWAGDFLFRDGRYRADLVDAPAPGLPHTMTDCLELMSWWDWSPLGPWNTPFDRLKEVLTPEQIAMWQPYFVKDPVTGRTMWNNQPGDYRGYNARFGGLPAFRAAIARYRKAGALVTLYTDPFRLDGNSDTGRRFGKAWGVVGPDGKSTSAYEVWNPCHDNPNVRAWVAATMGRVMRETGADGIRLDEYGHMGWACFSTQHRHSFSERGVSQWNKAVADATRRVHAAMDRVRTGLVLTIEHPGYDYLMPYIEGCITYDLTVQACPLRPLECNLQRFYFPECKSYELDYRPLASSMAKKLWNAEGSFGTPYPKPMYVVLSENQDAYAARASEPLMQTLARYVYANRYAAPGGKTLYHLYNASGHTFDGPVLRVAIGKGDHIVDLLRLRECRPDTAGAVRLLLARDEVACLARVPKHLTVSRAGAMLRIRTGPARKAGRLVVCGPDGGTLVSRPTAAGMSRIDLSSLPANARPVAVKLLVNGSLADLVEVPQ